MKVVYILFKQNGDKFNPPFIVGVYENEKDAYTRKQKMFEPEKYFIEEWEVQ